MSARKTKPQPKTKNQNLQVFVRCRPPNSSESNHRSSSVVEINGHREIAVIHNTSSNSKIARTFLFDRVFGPSASQREVYHNVVEPFISDVLAGFNCTVFAYGQTGSGKTFTMEGDFATQKLLSLESNAGLIPRAMCALFDELRVLQAEYTVRISLMELYNEELYDLLSADEVPPKLRLFDDASKKGCVHVQGLQEVMVHNQSQVLEELRKGSAKRQVAATLLNAHSSRSHTIFTVTIHFKENTADGEEYLRVGKLNLVDLAGSENIGRSGSTDKRAREAASINQSLLTLSRVTSCLVEHQPHVPYRESKLTRLLQDSLGGRNKTSLIATISPLHLNVEETISTLDYALRAKCVSNRPEVNQKVSQNVIMKEYTDVIESLKKKLERHRNGSGFYVNDENYRQILEQTQARNKAICDLIEQNRSICHRIKEAEETFAALSKDKENCKRNLENVNQFILQTQEEIELANKDLLHASVEQKESVNILKDVSNKENELRMQACQCVKVIDSALGDAEKIYRRLDFSRDVIAENKVVLQKLREKSKFYKASATKLLDVVMESETFLHKLSDCVEKVADDGKSNIVVLQQAVNKQLQNLAFSLEVCKRLFFIFADNLKALPAPTLAQFKSYHERQILVTKKIVEVLKDAISSYNKLLSVLPQQSSSLLEFLQESVENLKMDVRNQVKQVEENISTAVSVSKNNTETLGKLLGKLLLQEEKTRFMKHHQVMAMNRSAIDKLLSDCANEISRLTLEFKNMLATKENFLCEIKKKMCATADYHKQQPTAVLFPISELKNKIASSKTNLENQFKSVIDCSGTLTELSAVATKSKDDVHSLLNSDLQSAITQIISMCKDVTLEGSAQMKSEVSSLMNSAEDVAMLLMTIPSNYDKIRLMKTSLEEKKDEILGMFLDGISSAKTEVQECCEERKKEISDMVSFEINQDAQTGLTPIRRRSYGDIPTPSFLPSPIKRTAKSKIQRAPWKKLLRSPRKPHFSTNNLSDFNYGSNDGMASDSELSLSNKAFGPCKLQKASSFSDLRLHSKSGNVFHRPGTPKKIAP
ncbi:Kinesin-like protein KIF11-A [Frankliniella fusca]|uniref:Kinesin-like protein KIF11-A n=1 Tax=Frankliniella fusca TaxID=407009 RepID=A0AAE1LA39_9NEOP|nr:Kinesin-like protein KIF11-A [Frankliniella fusca]